MCSGGARAVFSAAYLLPHTSRLQIFSRNKRRSAATHACMPRTVRLLYPYRKKHGGSKFHLSFVRPFGPDFAPALPWALDLFLYFDIVFSIILDLPEHVRYGQTTDEEVAQPMRCKHSGLILPAPKRRKNNSLNPAAKRLDNNLLLHNLSLNNSNLKHQTTPKQMSKPRQLNADLLPFGF